MSDEIIVTEISNLPVASEPKGLFQLEPNERVEYAVKIANVLKDVIKKQKLTVALQGREYVKAEGWITLGSLLGILPKENYVRRHNNGSYEVGIDLVRQADGRVISGASSLCGVDEKRWGSANEYARRSMAATRATGKAYRLAFGWIMAIAGYETTPADEMPDEEEVFHKKEAPKVIKAVAVESNVYFGTQKQKIELAKVFSKLQIIDVEKQKKAAKEILEATPKVDMNHLEEAVAILKEGGII